MPIPAYRLYAAPCAAHHLARITKPKATHAEPSGSVQPILSTMLAHGG
jgi:hypothetical protein